MSQSYCDYLIETANTLTPLLHHLPKATNDEKDRLRARVIAVMTAQGIPAVEHDDSVYIRSGKSLLCLPCSSGYRVANAVPVFDLPESADPLTADQIMDIFDASEPSDEELEEAALFEAGIDVMGDDFTSRLPIRHERSRSDVFKAILEQANWNRGNGDAQTITAR